MPLSKLDTRKLEKLMISEVSGVDDPANESPGWIVLKRRGQAIRSKLLKRAAGEPIHGFFAVADRKTGQVTEFTGTEDTPREDYLKAMLVAGFDPDTAAVFNGGKPVTKSDSAYASIEASLRKMKQAPQLTAGPDEIPEGAGEDPPIPGGNASGKQPTGAGDGSQRGMPKRQARDGAGKFRRTMITHRGASLFR
ncbi:MAG TPA: hypothetical protein VIP09_11710 [Dehalococcoidia bacterium]